MRDSRTHVVKSSPSTFDLLFLCAAWEFALFDPHEQVFVEVIRRVLCFIAACGCGKDFLKKGKDKNRRKEFCTTLVGEGRLLGR